MSDLPLAYDPAATADLVGVNEATVRRLIRADKWPTPVVRIGKQYRVLGAPLRAYLGAGIDNANAA